MKFRAKAVDLDCIHHFTDVMNTIQKLLKTCALRITQEKIFFIMPDQITNGGVSMWCEIKQEHFFDLYQVEGVSNDNNEIYLEIVAENICRALKSAHNAKSLKIKLTKKQLPCLTFEIELPSLRSKSQMVTHDIPVSVIPVRLWSEFLEPEMPDFHVCICMPSLKVLKNIGEKLKNISSYVTLHANQLGVMKFSTETELVSTRLTFTGLETPKLDEDSQAPSNSWPQNEFASVRIDIKKLLQLFASQQINPFKVVCNVINNSAVHFFIVHDDISLQYFIPAVQL